MKQIPEEELTFSFPDNAQVYKYDDTKFYRNQFIKMADGIKAMDLAYIDGQTCWLIEVKDYRAHQRTKPSELPDEIADKLRNTLAGLWAAKCNANDQDEKRFAAAAIKAKRIRVVLHLEESPLLGRLAPAKSLKAGLQQKMKQKLKSVDAHPCVVDQRSLKPEMNWTVAG